MSHKHLKCPNCNRRFADTNAAYQHVKNKHGSKGIAQFRPENQPGYEPSYADLVIDARLNAAMGLPVDDDIASMFHDDIYGS